MPDPCIYCTKLLVIGRQKVVITSYFREKSVRVCRKYDNYVRGFLPHVNFIFCPLILVDSFDLDLTCHENSSALS